MAVTPKILIIYKIYFSHVIHYEYPFHIEPLVFFWVNIGPTMHIPFSFIILSVLVSQNIRKTD